MESINNSCKTVKIKNCNTNDSFSLPIAGKISVSENSKMSKELTKIK
jgi:hypothetical protein